MRSCQSYNVTNWDIHLIPHTPNYAKRSSENLFFGDSDITYYLEKRDIFTTQTLYHRLSSIFYNY